MVSVCLPSDALLQHLPSYLGFSYLWRGVSLHGCSSKAQPLLLTLDEGYLLTAALPDLQCGIAPLGPLVPAQPQHITLTFFSYWFILLLKYHVELYQGTDRFLMSSHIPGLAFILVSLWSNSRDNFCSFSHSQIYLSYWNTTVKQCHQEIRV